MRDVEPLWSIEEVAEYLSIPVESVYKLTSRRSRIRIPHVKLGGRLRFRQADIARWLDLLAVSNLDQLEKVKRAAARA